MSSPTTQPTSQSSADPQRESSSAPLPQWQTTVGDSDEEETVQLPPCDLWSDEPPLESSLHLQQIILLLSSLNWLWGDRNDYFAAGNLTVYYSEQEMKNRQFRGPDFFVALGTENRPRRSWMVWVEDGKYPDVIVELLSRSTAKVDRGLKKELYQDTFRTPNYFWFHPETMEFAGFYLVAGKYEALEPNEDGWLWSEQLGLYLGIHDRQLRFFMPDGTIVPTPEEVAAAQQQQLEAERQRSERLTEKLRSLGIDPDSE